MVTQSLISFTENYRKLVCLLAYDQTRKWHVELDACRDRAASLPRFTPGVRQRGYCRPVLAQRKWVTLCKQ